MRLSPKWVRDFVDLTVDDRQFAEALTAVGIAVEGTSGAGDNTVWEMEIGTNRPDAMNHYGVAREASAIYNVPLKAISPKLPASVSAEPFSIVVQEPDLCPRFTGRVIRDVKIKPAPAKLTQRLGLLDQRPINNAVDATNYVLWEMGKPTHVFDLDLLEGGKIIVRKARAGETLKTLDGVERKLTTEDLVVADAKKPVALAGTMGGFDTMITDKTKNILIESAWWDPVTVRKMSRRHALHTDASHRFERGADFESTVVSCDRVAELILESADGQLHGGVVDVVSKQMEQAPIGLRVSEVHRILGGKLDTQDIFRTLDKLGFELMPERGGECDFTVRIPSWRLDVEREIDLIEEIARLYGYDKFANTLPAYAGAVVARPDAAKDQKLRTELLALGYNEAVSLSFISHEDAETFSPSPVIELANPLSEEAAIMRTSLVPGVLNMIAFNLNRGTQNVRLFEAGNVYAASGAQAVQSKQVCFAATGSAARPSAPAISFFDLKGDVETLLHAFEHRSLSFDANVPEYLHPGRSARALVDGKLVAQFGQLSPDVAGKRKIRNEVFIVELFSEALYKQGLRKVLYQPLPKFPAVQRDFSFTFDDSVVFAAIQLAVTGLHLSDLREFTPAETFRGGNVPAGKYSILLRATFQSSERTLREDEVAQWTAQIVKALEGLGGKIRS